MAKARARTATRKVKDKWKSKQWYTLLAPPMFQKATVAETLSDDPNKVLHRVISTTLQDLTGDFKLMHVKVEFQVHTVNGTQGETHFIGHSLTSDYVRRLVRRNHSKISGVFDVTTKDQAVIRVKPFAVTDRRSQSTQQTAIRNLMHKTSAEHAAEKTFAEFCRDMFDGKLAARVYRAAKVVYPLRKIEVNKSEVLSQPTIQMEEPAPTPAPTTTDERAAPPEPPVDTRTPEEGGPEEPPAEETAPPAA